MGATKHPQPVLAATGVERPAQRLLPAAAAGNFKQSFLLLLPQPPRDPEPPRTSPGPKVTGAETEVPAPVLVLRVLASAARAPGLGGGCFPSGHRLVRFTRYAMPGPARSCPAPKLARTVPPRSSLRPMRPGNYRSGPLT